MAILQRGESNEKGKWYNSTFEKGKIYLCVSVLPTNVIIYANTTTRKLSTNTHTTAREQVNENVEIKIPYNQNDDGEKNKT